MFTKTTSAGNRAVVSVTSFWEFRYERGDLMIELNIDCKTVLNGWLVSGSEKKFYSRMP